MKILIPTCQSGSTVAPLASEIRVNTPGADVFASCLDASASVNRNACLDRLKVGEVAVMVDDDVRAFYRGWLDDLLVGLGIPNAVMVSARLLNPDGTAGPTCSGCMEDTPDEIVVPWRGHCVLPTAAIAFVHRGHYFNEGFRGSGWEDNLWCAKYLHADPQARFVQSNRCRLVHENLMRGQKGENWQHNKQHFFRELEKLNAQHG